MKPPLPPRRYRATALWSVLFLLATTAGVWLLYSTTQLQQQERLQAADTTRTLLMLRDYNRIIMQAETNQRGYLLTGDERYWTGYNQAVARAPDSVNKVRDLPQYANDPHVRQGVEHLVATGDRKLEELARTISMVRAGELSGAMALVRSHAGYEFMDSFRNELERVERYEVKQLQIAADRAEAAGSRLGPLIALLTSVMFLALLGSAWQSMRATRAESRVKYLGEVEKARERADLLARELNHRVKNIFTIVLSIIRMTAREEPDPVTVADRCGERILALATAHDLWQGDKHAAVDFHDLVAKLLAPYHEEGERLTIAGDIITLPGKDSTSVCLILHELATNAVKYGAWSSPTGIVDVQWRCEGNEVVIDWREHGGPALDGHLGNGFGSTMITASTRMLRGAFSREIKPEGLTARLTFPADECVIQPYEK